MAIEIKLELIQFEESDLFLPDYCEGKFANLNDADLKSAIDEMITEAIIENRLYLDYDDIAQASEELFPLIEAIIFNPRYSYIKADYALFCEFITYLTVRLA